jgi:WbqC-like protein family
MTRSVVIHQPDFIPWLGFFHRFIRADLYVALDHVQFVSGTAHSWTHRDRLKTPAGPRWLTLTIQKAPLGTPINEIALSEDDGWKQANLNFVRENYRRAPYFEEIFPKFSGLYQMQHKRLVDMTLASIDLLQNLLGTPIRRVLSSELQPTGSRNEMLVDILKKVQATHYLSGAGARAYHDPLLFERAGIEVVWQQFSHPIYPQQHGSFVANLSSLDLLLNCGSSEATALLRSCR